MRPPDIDVPATAARRLRDSLELIATIVWWSPEGRQVAKDLGLPFMEAYVWGRAAPLGADAPAAVVVAAFGVLEPDRIAPALVAARTKTTPDAMLAGREAGARAGLLAATPSVDPAAIDALGTRLLAALTEIDGTARPLFSGLRALPVPSDPYGRLWRAAELVREHRGDGHLAACIGAGLGPVEMNVLTELWLGYPLGEYSATRGHSPQQIAAGVERLRARGWLVGGGELTSAGIAARRAIETATDGSQQELVDQLGADIDWVIASASSISSVILAAGVGPTDPRKRAAG